MNQLTAASSSASHWQPTESGYSLTTVEEMTSEMDSRPSLEDTNSEGTETSPIEGPAGHAGREGHGEATTPEQSEEESSRAEAVRLRDQLLRLAADFDNYRKRTRKEILDAERVAREEVIRELLPVFDNLQRAGQHAEQATDLSSLADGIGMVLSQFLDTLGHLGVERISAQGVAFDPLVHEAVQQVETTDFPPGCIAAELLTGYRWGERLIRPAMVVVAKAPPATTTGVEKAT